MAVVAATVLVLAAVLAVGLLRDPSPGSADDDSIVAAAGPATTGAAAAPVGVANPGSVPTGATAPPEDLAIALDGDCTIEATRLALGDSGVDVHACSRGSSRPASSTAR